MSDISYKSHHTIYDISLPSFMLESLLEVHKLEHTVVHHWVLILVRIQDTCTIICSFIYHENIRIQIALLTCCKQYYICSHIKMDINFNVSLGAVDILYCCAILNCVKSHSFIVTLFDFTPINSG